MSDRPDTLRAVWVSVYSSCWLFVACFSRDTLLQQLICHDRFLPCLSDSTCCQIKHANGKYSVWQRVPSIESTITSSLYLFRVPQTFLCCLQGCVLFVRPSSPSSRKKLHNDLNDDTFLLFTSYIKRFNGENGVVLLNLRKVSLEVDRWQSHWAPAADEGQGDALSPTSAEAKSQPFSVSANRFRTTGTLTWVMVRYLTPGDHL